MKASRNWNPIKACPIKTRLDRLLDKREEIDEEIKKEREKARL